MKNKIYAISVLLTVCTLAFLTCVIEEGQNNYKLTVIIYDDEGSYRLAPRSSNDHYPAGETVKITATPNSGFFLEHIKIHETGEIINDSTMEILMDRDKTVAISFGKGEGDKKISKNNINWTNNYPIKAADSIAYPSEFSDRISVENKHLVLKSVYTGPNLVWDWQIYQPNFNYVQGQYYRVELYARVEGAARNIQIVIQEHGRPYTTYAGSNLITINSAETKKYEICINPHSQSKNDHNAKLAISLGSDNVNESSLILESVTVMQSSAAECGASGGGGFLLGYSCPTKNCNPITNQNEWNACEKPPQPTSSCVVDMDNPPTANYCCRPPTWDNVSPTGGIAPGYCLPIGEGDILTEEACRSAPNHGIVQNNNTPPVTSERGYCYWGIFNPGPPANGGCWPINTAKETADCGSNRTFTDAQCTGSDKLTIEYCDWRTTANPDADAGCYMISDAKGRSDCLQYTNGVYSDNQCKDLKEEGQGGVIIEPGKPNWNNPYSSAPVVTYEGGNNTTFNDNGSVTVKGNSSIVDSWDISMGQGGFNYTSNNMPVGSRSPYSVTITGTVTDKPVSFSCGIQESVKDYLMYVSNHEHYSPVTIPVGSFNREIPFYNMGGNPQKGTDPIYNRDDPNAMLIFLLGYPNNGTITINSLTVNWSPVTTPSNLNWYNPYSTVKTVQKNILNPSGSGSITFNEDGSITVVGSNQVTDEDYWTLGLQQTGFDYSKPSGFYEGPSGYSVVVSGSVTGGSMSFETAIQNIGTADNDNDWRFHLWGGRTLPSGTFKDYKIPLLNSHHYNTTNKNAQFIMFFGQPENAGRVLTITSLTIMGPQ